MHGRIAVTEAEPLGAVLDHDGAAVEAVTEQPQEIRQRRHTVTIDVRTAQACAQSRPSQGPGEVPTTNQW